MRRESEREGKTINVHRGRLLIARFLDFFSCMPPPVFEQVSRA